VSPSLSSGATAVPTERCRRALPLRGGVRPGECRAAATGLRVLQTWSWNPRRSFGPAAVRNVRTESRAEDYRAGAGRDELGNLYDLTLEQVDSAIRFELIAGAERAADRVGGRVRAVRPGHKRRFLVAVCSRERKEALERASDLRFSGGRYWV
jgi:uncharacterized protein (DUF433 family)